MIRITVIVLAVLVGAVSMFGISCLDIPEYEMSNVYVDRPVVKLVKVETTKGVTKEVEVEKGGFVRLKDWENKDELLAFLAEDDSDKGIVLVADSDGIIDMTKLDNQCEDRAIALINNAQFQGRRLFFIPLPPSEYLKWYGETISDNMYHAVCGALVGDNEFYYIEPSDDRCWLALYLD